MRICNEDEIMRRLGRREKGGDERRVVSVEIILKRELLP